jgi:hypothetical protein
LGWAVWPLRADEWIDQVTDAAAVVALPEDYSEVSLLWAQSLDRTGVDEETAGRLTSIVDDLGGYAQRCIDAAVSRRA